MPARKWPSVAVRTPFFEVRRSAIQGFGAFAVKKIRKGQRIIEYAGERISNEEADRRYDESKMRRHHTFLFTLDDATVVDGAVQGNASIYINHSCEPNCEAVITGTRIYIRALRTVYPGEELAYDYQYERTGESDEELERFYKCRCGTPTCRGTIMAPPKSRRRMRRKLPAKDGDSSRSSAKGSKQGRNQTRGTRVQL